MSAESPAEYIERLRAENKALRRGLLKITREEQALEEHVARLYGVIAELRGRLGWTSRGPDFARPGISEVD